MRRTKGRSNREINLKCDITGREVYSNASYILEKPAKFLLCASTLVNRPDHYIVAECLELRLKRFKTSDGV
jgi:hypothetical protein